MKKVLALVLSLAMLLTCASFPAFAEGEVVAIGITGGTTTAGGAANFPRTWDGVDRGTGNTYTSDWKDSAGTQTFTWNFDGFYDLTEVNVLWLTGWDLGEYDGYPKQYTISTTTDGGVTWTEAGTYTNETSIKASTYNEEANALMLTNDYSASPKAAVNGLKIKVVGFGANYIAIGEVHFNGVKCPTADYTVTHKYADGSQAAEPTTGVALVGSTVAPAPLELEGYYAAPIEVEVTSTDAFTIDYVYYGELTISGAAADKNTNGEDGVSRPASNMIDNDENTFWHHHTWTATEVSKLTFTLDDLYLVKAMKVVWPGPIDGSTLWGNGHNGLENPDSYTVWTSVSESGDADWVQVASYPDETRDEATDILALSGAAKRVQIRAVGSLLGCAEVDVYGYQPVIVPYTIYHRGRDGNVFDTTTGEEAEGAVITVTPLENTLVRTYVSQTAETITLVNGGTNTADVIYDVKEKLAFTAATATTSGQASKAEYMIDGLMTTGWGASWNGAATLTFTLDKLYELDALVINWTGKLGGSEKENEGIYDFNWSPPAGYDNNGDGQTTASGDLNGMAPSDNYTVEISSSDSGDDWVEVVNIGSRENVGVTLVDTLEIGHAAKRIRIKVASYSAITEIEAYGKEAKFVEYTIEHVNQFGEVFDTTTYEDVVGAVVTVEALEDTELYTFVSKSSETITLVDGGENKATVTYNCKESIKPVDVDYNNGTESWNDSGAPGVGAVAHLTDGDTSTRWMAQGYNKNNPNNDVLTFTFAEARDFESMSILWTAQASGGTDWNKNGGCAPSSFNVMISQTDDGDDWTTIYTVTDTAATSNLTTIKASDAGVEYVTAKRVKIAIHKYAARCGIEEITFVGPLVQTAGYTVKYVNNKGVDLLEPLTGTAVVGKELTPSVPAIDGYIAPSAQTITIDANADNNVVTYKYAVDYDTTATIVNAYDYQNKAMTATYNGNKTDNAYTTEWGGTNTLKHFTWEFDKLYDIAEVEIVWQSGWALESYAGGCEEYTIEASFDGKAWYKVQTVTGMTESCLGSERVTHNIELDNMATNVKAIRVIGTKWFSDYPGITEVTFMGANAQNPVSENVIRPVAATSTKEALVEEGVEATYDVSYMIDGDDNTMFAPDAWTIDVDEEPFVTYTYILENLTDVESITMINAKNHTHSWGLVNNSSKWQDFSISVSSDGITYTPVYDVTGAGLVNGVCSANNVEIASLVKGVTVTDFGTTDMSAVKYIQLTVTKGSLPSVAELYVTGSDVVEVAEGVSVTTKGAGIRPETATYSAGIRFAADITASALENGKAGMLLLPKAYVTGSLVETANAWLTANNTTLDEFIGDATKSKEFAAGSVLVIPAAKYSVTGDVATYTGVLIGIPSEKYNMDVCAVPYYIDAEGVAHYGVEDCKSIYTVAKNLKNDTTRYEALSQTEKDNVDAIIAAVEG